MDIMPGECNFLCEEHFWNPSVPSKVCFVLYGLRGAERWEDITYMYLLGSMDRKKPPSP